MNVTLTHLVHPTFKAEKHAHGSSRCIRRDGRVASRLISTDGVYMNDSMAITGLLISLHLGDGVWWGVKGAISEC